MAAPKPSFIHAAMFNFGRSSWENPINIKPSPELAKVCDVEPSLASALPSNKFTMPTYANDKRQTNAPRYPKVVIDTRKIERAYSIYYIFRQEQKVAQPF
jgi:hypothetical protein